MVNRCGLYAAPRWAPLQVALCSTYEENQVIAAELAKKLPFAEMEINVWDFIFNYFEIKVIFF